MIANILHAYPSPIALGDGSKLFFSEHGHVAYQIKGNHNCNNLVANLKPSDPPPPPPDPGGQKVKMQLFQNRVGVIKIVINCNLITFSKVIVCNCN